jgi:hypothetical protein
MVQLGLFEFGRAFYLVFIFLITCFVLLPDLDDDRRSLDLLIELIELIDYHTKYNDLYKEFPIKKAPQRVGGFKVDMGRICPSVEF